MDVGDDILAASAFLEFDRSATTAGKRTKPGTRARAGSPYVAAATAVTPPKSQASKRQRIGTHHKPVLPQLAPAFGADEELLTAPPVRIATGEIGQNLEPEGVEVRKLLLPYLDQLEYVRLQLSKRGKQPLGRTPGGDEPAENADLMRTEMLGTPDPATADRSSSPPKRAWSPVDHAAIARRLDMSGVKTPKPSRQRSRSPETPVAQAGGKLFSRPSGSAGRARPGTGMSVQSISSTAELMLPPPPRPQGRASVASLESFTSAEERVEAPVSPVRTDMLRTELAVSLPDDAVRIKVADSTLLNQESYPTYLATLRIAEPSVTFTPRFRPTSWLLRLIEEIYDERLAFQYKSLNKPVTAAPGGGGATGTAAPSPAGASVPARKIRRAGEDTATSTRRGGGTSSASGLMGNDDIEAPEQFPVFVFHVIRQRFGLHMTSMQAAWDFVFNIEIHRETYPEAELMSRFLNELYGLEDLAFFLHVRDLVQSQFGIQLKSKEKLTDVVPSRKLPPELSVALVDHPLLGNGTQVAYVPLLPCKIMLRALLSSEPLAALCTELVVQPHAAVIPGFPDPMISIQDLLEKLLLEFRRVDEDIIRKLKYGESKSSLTELAALKQTMMDAGQRQALADRHAELMVELAALKVNAAALERRNHDGSLRTQVFLARNQVWSKEQEVEAAAKEVALAEKKDADVWNTILGGSPASKPTKRSLAATQQTDPQFPELIAKARLRIEIWMNREARRRRLQRQALNAMADTWSKHLENLKERAVLRIQRAFRARKAAKRAQEEAQEHTDKLRAERKKRLAEEQARKERRDAAAARKAAREAELRAAQEAEQKAADAKKQAMMRQRRQELADFKFNKVRIATLTEKFKRWKLYRVLVQRQRVFDRRNMAKRFVKWRGYAHLVASTRKAATTIQCAWRVRVAKRVVASRRAYMKRSDVRAERILRRILRRTQAAAFEAWWELVEKRRRVKAMLRRSMQSMQQKSFQAFVDNWRQVKDAKSFVALKLQSKYRGDRGRARVAHLRVQHAAARHITAFMRIAAAKKLVARMRADKAHKEMLAHKFAIRIHLRGVFIAYNAWAEFTRKRVSAKRMARRLRLRGVFRCVAAWKSHTDRCNAARARAALALQRRFRKRRAIFAARSLIRRNKAAFGVQRFFKWIHSNVVLLNVRRRRRAAITVQRVFRGFATRKALQVAKAQNAAAVRIQAMVRGKLGRAAYLRLCTDTLMTAADTRNFEAVQAAFEGNRAHFLDKEGNNVLVHATLAGSKRIAKLCLREGVPMNRRNPAGDGILHCLIRKSAFVEQVPMLSYLVSRGADPELKNSAGETAIAYAAALGRAELITALAQQKVDIEAVDGRGFTPLHKAAAGGFVPALQALVKAGANLQCTDSTGATPLHDAAAANLVNMIQWLISLGAVVDVQDLDGFTPLHLAVTHHSADAITSLLELDAQPTTGDNTGRTALHLAAQMHHTDLIGPLVFGTSDPNQGDQDKDTPLHYAAGMGFVDVCRALLENGADVNSQNSVGNTPLHVAATQGYVDVVALLVEYDANVNMKNYDGQNALGAARMAFQTAVVKYLNEQFAVAKVKAEAAKLDDLPTNPALVIGTGGDQWEKSLDAKTGSPFWRNMRTGEVSWDDPTEPIEKVLQRRHAKQVGPGDVSVVDYRQMWEAENFELLQERRKFQAAVKIQKIMRGALVRIRLARQRKEHAAGTIINRSIRGYLARTWVRRLKRNGEAATKIQSVYRGHRSRRRVQQIRWDQHMVRAREWAAGVVGRVYRGFVGRKRARLVRFQKTRGPKNFDEWNRLKNESVVIRRFNVWEELQVPGTLDVKFYHNRFAGTCQWDKPREWVINDRKGVREAEEVRIYGHTKAQAKAAAYLQARWRGKQTRRTIVQLHHSIEMYHTAQDKYLRNPTHIPNLCNYMVYLVCAPPHDFDRARPLFVSAMDYMSKRGPDNAFVLYAFALYLAATLEEDFPTIELLLSRARRADRTGKSFEAAELGFYRQSLVENPRDGLTLMNYAIIRQFLHADYKVAEKYYLKAIAARPDDERIMLNLNYMLEYHVGAEYTGFDAYRKVQEELATKEQQYVQQTEDYRRWMAARSVQRIYRASRTRRILAMARETLDTQLQQFVSADDGAGNTYYYNTATGSSTWQLPTLAERVQKLSVLGVWNGTTGVLGGRFDTGGLFRPQEDYGDDPNHWEACDDGQGHTYYYNTQTGASQWDVPKFNKSLVAELLDAEAARKALAQAQEYSQPVATHRDSYQAVKPHHEWETVQAEDGTSYLYHPETGETKPMDQDVDVMAWEELLDNYGNVYWYNSSTGETTTQDPRAAKPVDRDEDRQADVDASNAAGNAFSNLVVAAATDAGLGGMWEQFTTDDGHEYWYNSETGESTWTKPASEPVVAAAAALPDGWEAVEDDDHNVYYYNSVTGVSTWERPTQPAAAEASDTTQAAGAPAQGDESDVWEQVTTTEGTVYYYNTRTGVSSWEKPVGWQAADAPALSATSDWEPIEGDDGSIYYYNHVTGESSWTLPAV